MCKFLRTVTLFYGDNKFSEKNIEIVEVDTYTSEEVAEKLLLALFNQEYIPILKDVSGCQNWINLKVNGQMFRIIVEEVAT